MVGTLSHPQNIHILMIAPRDGMERSWSTAEPAVVCTRGRQRQRQWGQHELGQRTDEGRSDVQGKERRVPVSDGRMHGGRQRAVHEVWQSGVLSLWNTQEQSHEPAQGGDLQVGWQPVSEDGGREMEQVRNARVREKATPRSRRRRKSRTRRRRPIRHSPTKEAGSWQ